MDSKQIRDVCIQSCADMYEQMAAMQRGCDRHENHLIAKTINDIASMTIKEDYVVIGLRSRINDIDGLAIYVKNKGEYRDEVVFDNYDDRSVTLCAYPNDELMQILMESDKDDVKIVYDMKWLIKLTETFYENHGHSICYPREPTPFSPDDYTFPGGTPNDDQRDAVDAVLNNNLSYIWGAPGTGKTQFVIATAVIAHLRRGEKVIIVAPTNNAVEQALIGIVKAIEKDDPYHDYIVPERDILRLGSATREFLEKYRGLCTDRSRSAEIERYRRTAALMDNILFERRVELLKGDLDEIVNLFEGEYDKADYEHKQDIMKQIMNHWEAVKKTLQIRAEFSDLAENVDEYNLRSAISEISYRLTNRRRYELEIEEYKKKSDVEIADIHHECIKEIDRLAAYDENARVKSAKILAMTPFTFMARADTLLGPNGISEAGHIFIDEVGYANLIHMLPLFAVGAPIAMLGDHMQLPPVCELDREKIETWAERGGYMEYAFLWDTSARFSESLLFKDITEVRDDYLNNREPEFRETKQVNLLHTHRFADNLASILDKCVYNNGITGSTDTALEILCLDVVGDNGKTRANRKEAEAVKTLLDSIEEGETFAVLTPYKDHLRAIVETCGKNNEKNILTIHSSQGREWDTVILSVSDNRNSDRPVPYRFTSTVEGEGLKVINTAVSRAKKRLIIVCDREFWKSRADKNELIGMLLSGPDVKVI